MITNRAKWPLLAISLLAAVDAYCRATTKCVPEAAILEWRGRTLHPKTIISEWNPRHRAGDLSLGVSNGTVTARNAETDSPIWTLNSPIAGQLEFLCAVSDSAYFKVKETNAVMRLDLALRKWSTDLLHQNRQEVLAAVTTSGRVFVLSGNFATEEEIHGSSLTDYRISAFSSGASNLWSRSFKGATERETPPKAFLLSGRMPNRANSSVNYLSLSGDDVVICAGPKEDVICLDQKTGTNVWSIERIWEFARGFIGPSVWSHFISRFGEDFPMSGEKAVNPEVRKAFVEKWDCDILGGPIVVSGGGTDWDRFHVFVAVSRKPREGKRGEWGRYLSDCIVYEIDGSGQVASMVTMPRLVRGSQAYALPSAVVWDGQNNSLFRAQLSQDGQSSQGPGGFDRTTRLDWYRELEGDTKDDFIRSNKRGPWLTVDKAGDAVAFGSSHVFKVTRGGYINREDDKLFNFPIEAIDYTNAAVEEMLLKLPLKETVPLPATNISGTKTEHHTIGPYYLGITLLRTDEDRLTIVVGEEGATTGLVFDIGSKKTER